MSPKKESWRKRWRKNPVISVFTSLRLTVTLLTFSLALVFFGTLDQVNIGINKAQKDYFESFYVVWEYPEEWPLGTKMVLVTHPENDIAKKHDRIAIDDKQLESFRFLGFMDNSFHSQIKSVFEDSEGSLEPDPNLRFHTLQEIKSALSTEEYKNGYGAILPDSAMEQPKDSENANKDSKTEPNNEPDLALIGLEGQMPFALRGLPVPLPGGYLLGGLLLINLMTSAAFRYQLKIRHAGIWITHSGLALMLISELVTDLTEKESIMILDEGESANFSKDFHADEFVLIDESGEETDEVLSLPINLLDPEPDNGGILGNWFKGDAKGLQEINLKDSDSRFPFVLEVKKFYKNADFNTPKEGDQSFTLRNANGRKVLISPIEQPETFRADEMNFRTAIVELRSTEDANKTIGKWLTSSFFDAAGYQSQRFNHGDKSYRLEIRRKRYHYDFHMELLDFRFLRYPGTDRPKDFSSDINIRIPGEPVRKTRIYMNHPLSLQGNTFFQAGFDSTTETQTRFQVVSNPGSILPYIGVTLVGLGLAVQFGFHLFGFAKRRKKQIVA
ncbi:MAG: cytochrome c biogenesis protein ResB [Verrucomicrobia bacterium]|nr:cytochrome c biogenesis protein ResB [Verrucomicrobiota bacterium]